MKRSRLTSFQLHRSNNPTGFVVHPTFLRGERPWVKGRINEEKPLKNRRTLVFHILKRLPESWQPQASAWWRELPESWRFFLLTALALLALSLVIFPLIEAIY